MNKKGFSQQEIIINWLLAIITAILIYFIVKAVLAQLGSG